MNWFAYLLIVLGAATLSAWIIRITRAKAIRLKCLDCCGGQAKEVRLCPCEKCPLFPYRFGHVPREGINTRQKKEDAKIVSRLNETGEKS